MHYPRSSFAALTAALYLAGCAQLPPAQTASQADAVVPLSPQPATRTLPSDVEALPASEQHFGEAQEPAPVSAEPRIIRGTDKIIASPRQQPLPGGSPITFNFEEAPVAEVVRTILGDVLKADYVIHPPIAGTVTLATRAPVTPDQAAFLLESALQANGLALVRDVRGAYHVGKPEALKSIGSAVRLAGVGMPLAPGYGAIIVPLQYIGAAEMATILRPLMPAESLVRVDTVRNLLVLTGTRTQAEGWLDLVATFDVDLLKGMSVGVFPLKYASIKEVESALRLMGSSGGTNTGAPAGAAATTSAPGASPALASAAASLGESNPLFGALRILPIERLNSILVVTPHAAYLDEARRWIERLDQPNDNSNERQLFIYQVQNVNAQHLATVLGGIFGGQSKAAATPAANSGVAPGLGVATGSSFGSGSAFGTTNAFGATNAFGSSSSLGSGTSLGGYGSFGRLSGSSTQQQASGNTQSATAVDLGGIRVIADQLNNSVLVWSTKSEYAKIESTLKRLDLPLTQVLIEAAIIEVTLNDDLEYGLEWAFKDSRATTGYRGAGSLLAAGASGTPFTPLSNGFSYALKNPAGNITALLKALSTKTTVKMIASPSLMVLDNHAASINVGTQTPIQAGETTTGTGSGIVTTSSTQYKDSGVQLVVTPSVNSGNIVTMQVDQSVTDVGAKDSTTGQPSFLQRQLSSKLAVRSGESIVMGGLIQNRGTTSKSGIPFLHTLPILGNLFGSTSHEGARTELIVIITPRVVRSDVDIREVGDELRDRMRGLEEVREFDASRVPASRRVPVPAPSATLPLPPLMAPSSISPVTQ